MMRIMLLSAMLGLAACSDPAHNLYDGIKSSNDAKRAPAERAVSPSPSYDQYKKERDTPAE